jgi:hemoglobin/transferrin/lactoferrin receptor protein
MNDMKTKTTLGTGRGFALSQLALGVGLAWSGVCAAQSEPVLMAAADAATNGEMKTVVVSASRVEEDADKVTGTVTVKTQKDIDRKKANNLNDLLDDEVGVSVRQQAYRSQLASAAAGRAGNEGVNIRGLEGDQVLLLVDGVSLPSAYTFGSTVAAGRGDYIDPEGYKRVELVRGATSTQYGSSGLAGSVMFVTKEPEDYLKDGKKQHFGVKTGYSSADKSFLFSPTYAFEAGDTKGLVVASQRRGEETDSMGTNSSKSTSRTEANPQSNRSDYVMGKLKQKVNADHSLKFTVESIRREINTDNLSAFGAVSGTATIYDDTSRDTITRTAAKLDWQFTPLNAWFDKLDLSVYAQTASTEQQSWQTRSSTARTRDAFYNEDTLGSSAQFERSWGDKIRHRLTYGADLRKSAYSMVVNRTGDATTPLSYFPDTDGKNYGAFAQDEIAMGAVKVTPGLRYDRYTLTPKATNTGSTTSYDELSDGAFSPKLGVSWDVQPDLTLYTLYTHGFRAPQAGQVNGSYSGSGYMTIGNPNLKSEQSDSIEFGTRGKAESLKYSAAMFYGKYKDFITDLVDTGPCNGVARCYQAQNLQSVTLMGLELRGDWAINNQWRTTAAYAHILGKSTNNGVDDYVATVDPDKVVATLQYSPSATWGTVGRMTAVDRKAGEPSGTLVAPGGYTVFDMTGWYQLNKSTSITAGLYNIFDKKYVRWSDVRALSTAALASTVDAYTQPGRNFAINLIHNF